MEMLKMATKPGAHGQGVQGIGQNCEKGQVIMPLVKSASPAAFRKNVKTEMAHGKPQKQALAISYAVKRAAAKKSSPPRSK